MLYSCKHLFTVNIILWLNGHEFKQAPGGAEGQGSLTCYIQSVGSQRVGHDWAFSNNYTPECYDTLPNKGVEVGFSETIWGFPGCSVVKNPPENPRNVQDTALIPELGRSPGGGHGNPLQYFCLENPMTEEPDGLQYIGSQRTDTTEVT